MSDTMTQTQGPTALGGTESLLRQVIARFREQNPGFLIGDDVIRRYHLAMQSRGFVILSGASGTGKTWLAQAYAEAVGARPKLAAVDPSWSSNEDLLGYLSPSTASTTTPRSASSAGGRPGGRPRTSLHAPRASST